MPTHIILPPLTAEKRLQGLRMIESGRNPKTGKPLSPGMKAALLAMRPAVENNINRLVTR